LTDEVVVPKRAAIPPTPVEVTTVRAFALAEPPMGYKRLTYALMLENKAFLRPWMVRAVLSQASLLGRRPPPPAALRRPPDADHPDQRWHTDLSMWRFAGQWFWLVDVLDSYSRYLIHCEVLLMARTEEVAAALQRARETLKAIQLPAGEPEIVHDGGPQFISHDWRTFVQGLGMTDVRTHPYHPQSNGRDERLHRTLREELPLAPDATLYQAQELIETYRFYYNFRRPHAALHYLRPHDYYRGDPAARLAERETNLKLAALARQTYWETH
jgi:transposase InsO family protein